MGLGAEVCGGVASLILAVACGTAGDGASEPVDAGTRDAATTESGAPTLDADKEAEPDVRVVAPALEASTEHGTLVVDHPRIVFDTDMGPDVDDAGALAVLHVLADRGDIELLAVGISTAGPGRSPAIPFVDAVNTYYGRPDIPIGVWKGGTFAYVNLYTAPVADDPARFPHDLGPENDDVPSAVELYRHVLVSESDQAVTLVSVGPLNNLLALLDSPPDDESPLDGVALVRAKVRLLVQMGGDHPAGNEFNFVFQFAPGTTAAVLSRWPTPVVFSGFALGAEILAGRSLAGTSERNPVRRAYELYTGNVGGNRQSWDLTAALVASLGTGSHWALTPAGTNRADERGVNEFTTEPGGVHRYLERLVEANELVEELDALLATAPRGDDAGTPP